MEWLLQIGDMSGVVKPGTSESWLIVQDVSGDAMFVQYINMTVDDSYTTKGVVVIWTQEID